MSKFTKTRRRFLEVAGVTMAVGLAGCMGSTDEPNMNDEDDMDDDSGMDDDEMDDDDTMAEYDGMDDGMSPTDPADAPSATIDRFSDAAGTLMVRTDENDLPGPNEPIDFDQQPFITHGLGPDGKTVSYYNFDVQPTAPAPIYAFFRANGDPVDDQLNIIDVVPGDAGYNDFWQVHKVTVPDGYEANTATSVSDITDADYEIEATSTIKNCPVIPRGSTASRHFGDQDAPPVVEGWYNGEVVTYFLFEEDTFETVDGRMPVSPIYVSFNVNPGEDGGGPASGFMTEDGTNQTHNVIATLPGDVGYSPLWSVNIYDNAEFEGVSDLESAMDATLVSDDGPTVNCPIVETQ